MHHSDIKRTYKNRFSELGHEKQFHLATRLALWNHDSWATKQVIKQKDIFLGGATHDQQRKKMREILSRNPHYAKINHSESRQPYFEANPSLFSLELALFQAMHARHHFDVDLTGCLPERRHIQLLIDTFVADPKALGTLSTFAVDIFYLYHRFLQQDDLPLFSATLLEQSCNESPSAQLSVYLLTHCIIGETLFYKRRIPERHRIYYGELTNKLNSLAKSNWHDLTLDNKLEIALCNQIAGVTSPLVRRAILDANSNYSKELGYIVDPQKSDKNTLEGSEHRNALYLMVTC